MLSPDQQDVPVGDQNKEGCLRREERGKEREAHLGCVGLMDVFMCCSVLPFCLQPMVDSIVMDGAVALVLAVVDASGWCGELLAIRRSSHCKSSSD